MKVTLPAGVKSISGAIKQPDGSQLVFKTFTRPSATRKKGETETRVYLMPKRKRATTPSLKERAVRVQFARATYYFKSISAEQRQMYEKEWQKAKYMFNGKKYCTLRGYIVARYYAEHPVDELIKAHLRSMQEASRDKTRGK